MDPLSSLGLASNLLQFVDFSRKLISGGVELYRSAEGASAANVELENITEDLQELSSKLAVPKAQQGEGTTSVDDEAVRKIAASCQQVSVELILVLQKIKVQSRHRKWDSARQALKSVWKENVIRSYSRRLDDLRSQLVTRIVAASRYDSI